MRSLLLLLLPLALRAAEAFTANETVVFLGDSITHGGRYHAYVEAYYLTRFPARPLTVINAGASGDVLAGALARFDRDVAAHKPTTVTIMLGMNDVSRGLYSTAAATDAQLAGRRKALDTYRENLTKLLTRLRDLKVAHIVLITPSPYDQTAQIDTNNNLGVNDALAECARIGRELAPTFNAEVIDFQASLTAANVARQQILPASTLVGQDRVHPGPMGHLAMAYQFLAQQKVPALVSRTVIDAKAAQATEAANIQIRNLVSTAQLLRWQAQPSTLPFPIDPEATEALTLFPIERDLNQELLRVTNLAPGRYRLFIDGAPVSTFTHSALAFGVNLAQLPTPQSRQAQEVLSLIERKRSLSARQRDIYLQDDRVLTRAGITWETDPKAAREAFDKVLAGLRAANSSSLAPNEANIQRYYDWKPLMAEISREMADLRTLIEQRRQPLPRLYSLERLP